MAFYVYILHCADGSYYAGHTDNLEMRIGRPRIGNACRLHTLEKAGAPRIQ